MVSAPPLLFILDGSKTQINIKIFSKMNTIEEGKRVPPSRRDGFHSELVDAVVEALYRVGEYQELGERQNCPAKEPGTGPH